MLPGDRYSIQSNVCEILIMLKFGAHGAIHAVWSRFMILIYVTIKASWKEKIFIYQLINYMKTES